MGNPVYSEPAPSITSLSTFIDVPSIVHVCPSCAHAQSVDLPDVAAFYDNDYKISLLSEDYDQLYAIENGVPLYRTEHQAELVLGACRLPQGARILDYGAAKASTLKRIAVRRPDLICHAFDVSRDYEAFWKGWIAPEAQAFYELPEVWRGTFDLITAHFVLEHVADPVAMLSKLAALLRSDGEVFISVPDTLSNPADLLVADHLNHFTKTSLTLALSLAGLKPKSFVSGAFRGAYTVVAVHDEPRPPASVQELQHDLNAIQQVASAWLDYGHAIAVGAGSARGNPVAIYGAGVYGSFIASRLKDQVQLECFFDRNPHLNGTSHLGVPVLAPDVLPAGIRTVFAGLNPQIARGVMETWKASLGRPELSIIYLEDCMRAVEGNEA